MPVPLRVSLDQDYPPYAFRSEEGELQGILVDLWRLWSRKTGYPVELIGLDWAEAQEFFKSGNAHVLDTVFWTEERAKQFAYSKPYEYIPVAIFYHKSIAGIRDVETLRRFPVAVKAGDAVVDQLLMKGVTNLHLFPSYESIVTAFTEGDARSQVFSIDEPSAWHHLARAGMVDQVRVGFTLYTGALHRAVLRGNETLLMEIEKGFALISPREYQALVQRWSGTHLKWWPWFRGILTALVLLGGGAMILGVFALVLRHQVRLRTAAIQSMTEALRQRSNELEGILRVAPVGLAVTVDGRFQRANERFCALTGYTNEELAGQSERLLYSNDAEYEYVRQKISEGIAQRSAARLETHWKRKDGRLINVLVSAAAVTQEASGEVAVAAMDITEHQRNLEILRVINHCLLSFGPQPQDNLRLIVETLGALARADAVIYCRRQGDTWTTQAVWSRVGWPRDLPSDFIRSYVDQLERRASATVALPDWFTAGPSTLDAPRFRQCRMHPVLVRDGLRGVLCVLYTTEILEQADETAWIQLLANATAVEEARWQAMEERIAAERQIQQAARLEGLGVLAGGVAHDFNNLLTAVLGHISLGLESLPPGTPGRSDIVAAEQATRRAAEMSRQLLMYAGKGRAEVYRVDLRRLIEEMIPMLKLAISKKVTLRFELASDVPLIQADAAQLQQVIMNLVVNASEAIGSDSGMVVVSTGLVKADEAYLASGWVRDPLPPGDYVYIEVADTGCGIPPEHLPRIFDPFFTTKFTGRGLGLAAVLGIVRAHRGTIHVESTVGKGSTFRVLLPAVAADEKLVATITEQESVWRGGGRILLVDDEESVRAVAARMLERLGFDVDLAPNGRQAIERFAAHPFGYSAVILDLTMPEMDGIEVLTRLRALRPDVPVFLSTGYDEADVTEQVRKSISGVLHKPYTLAALRELLRSALSH